MKSDADDYRYFPDPDLVMLHITPEHIERLKAEMPEMPRERRNRLKAEWKFSDVEMRDVINADALDLIEETVKLGASPAGAKKWWLGELSREANAKGISLEELPINAQEVADVEKLIAEAMAANPDVVEKLRSGNMKPMGAIIGAVMRATKGQADAKAVTKIVMEKIKG